MKFKDITTWTVTPDHKARPKNPFKKGTHGLNESGIPILLDIRFEQFADQHVYHCSPSLVAGEYPAADVELVWQYTFDGIVWSNARGENYSKYLNFTEFAKSIPEFKTREFLQLKTYSDPSPEKVVKTSDVNRAYLLELSLTHANNQCENIINKDLREKSILSSAYDFRAGYAEAESSHLLTRQYLQLKQPVKPTADEMTAHNVDAVFNAIHSLPESKEVESIPVKSAEEILISKIGQPIDDSHYSDIIEAMETYALQFKTNPIEVIKTDNEAVKEKWVKLNDVEQLVFNNQFNHQPQTIVDKLRELKYENR